jgi:hypothetical protein
MVNGHSTNEEDVPEGAQITNEMKDWVEPIDFRVCVSAINRKDIPLSTHQSIDQFGRNRRFGAAAQFGSLRWSISRR